MRTIRTVENNGLRIRLIEAKAYSDDPAFYVLCEHDLVPVASLGYLGDDIVVSTREFLNRCKMVERKYISEQEYVA
jgi:hypothetical protein